MQKEQKCPPTRPSSPLFRTTSSSWPHLLTRAPTRPLLLSALRILPPSGVVSPGNPSSLQGLPSALWTGLSAPGCSPLTSGPSLCLQSPLFPSRPSHPSRLSPPPSGASLHSPVPSPSRVSILHVPPHFPRALSDLWAWFFAIWDPPTLWFPSPSGGTLCPPGRALCGPPLSSKDTSEDTLCPHRSCR